MDLLVTLLKAPVFVLSLLLLLTIIVFVHEFGHFITARMLGVRVEVFSIGFGKAIWRRRDRYGTEWRISWLPLGGYVKFFGDLNAASQPDHREQKPVTTQFPNPAERDEVATLMSAEDRAQCFHFKPVWRRAAIVAAGPFSNFILAALIFAGFFMAFGRPSYDPVVSEVLADSAAADAGLQAGDRILSVNGRKIAEFADLVDNVMVSGGETLRLRIERSGEEVDMTLAPRRVDSKDRYGNDVQVWQIGIAVATDRDHYTLEKLGPGEALVAGAGEVWRMVRLTVNFLGKIISGKESPAQLGGPIKMAQYAGQSMMSGFADDGAQDTRGLWKKIRSSLVDFIAQAAVVSVSIGFLNLLPVPVLDGGHLMYYAYEAVAGRPMGARLQAIGFRVGFAMVASLMIFVTWNDINNLLSSIG